MPTEKKPNGRNADDHERLKPLSMHPLPLEDALRGALSIPPPPDDEPKEPPEDEEPPKKGR